MDEYREFQKTAKEQSRQLTRSDNILVATRLDREERPAGFEEERYSVQSARNEIITIDRLLNLPKSRLNLTDYGRYQLRLRKSRARSHVLLNDKKFLGDSGRMSLAKDALAEVEKALARTGTALNADSLADAEELYDTALTRCQEYIDNKNPWFSTGKERLRMIKDAKKRLTEEKKQLLAAKRMLEADGNAFAGCTCIREVLLRGQTELDRVDRNAPAPENLTWDHFVSMVNGDLKDLITFSGDVLSVTTSDEESMENRKVKEKLVELVKSNVQKDRFTKDFELRIRSRLEIDNSKLESQPLSKFALKEICDMVAEETSIVSTILSGPKPEVKDEGQDHIASARYAMANAVDSCIGTKKEAVALSKTAEESMRNIREELSSVMNQARELGMAVQPLTVEQLTRVILSDLGRLRDTVFSQLEDVYRMATVISGGEPTVYKGITANKELLVKISSLIIPKVAMDKNPTMALAADTELALLKRELAFKLAAKQVRRKKDAPDEPTCVEKLKSDTDNMFRLRELSSLGNAELNDRVKENETLRNADQAKKAAIKDLSTLADTLRLLKDFENTALQNGVDKNAALASFVISAQRNRANTIKGLFFNAKGEPDTARISAMEAVANMLHGTRFEVGFREAKKLLVEERFNLSAYVERLIEGCKPPAYQKAAYTRTDAFKDKTVEEQDALLLGFGKQDQLVLSAFMLRDDFTKLISSAKDKKAREIAHVKDVLRTFESGKAHVADVSIGSTTFTLVQKENDDLYIIMGKKQIPLSFGAAFLASRIEQSITLNVHLYGKAERNNVLQDADQEPTTGDVLTLRSLYINVLSREAKCTTEELSHLSLNDLKTYSKSFVEGTMTGEAVRSAVRARYSPALINGAEALDIMRMAKDMGEDELKNIVVYSEKEKEKAVTERKELYKQSLVKEEPWTPDELEVKNFITDLIYSEETWNADNAVTQPGARLFDLLKKNAKVIATLAVRRDLMPRVLRKLPIPGETLESLKGREELTGIKKQIQESLDGFLNSKSVTDAIRAIEEKQRQKEAEQEGGANADKNAGQSKKKSRESIENEQIIVLEAEIKAGFIHKTAEDFPELAQAEQKIEEAVNEAVNVIQDTAINLAKEMFGEDEGTEFRYQEQPKKMFEDLLYNPAILDNANDPDAMKEELCRLLKKHSGGFIQCVYKPGYIKDYLQEVREPENKDDLDTFRGVRDMVGDAIEDLAKRLRDDNSYKLLDGHTFEQEEDKERKIRSNDEVRKRFEDHIDVWAGDLFDVMVPTAMQAARSLQEEIKDPNEKDISESEKESRIAAGGKKLERIIAQTVAGDRGQGRFIKLIFSNYFKNVSLQDKRSMLASALRGAKSLSIRDTHDSDAVKQNALDSAIAKNYLGGFLKGAGPLLQKLLQGMPTSTLPPELKGAVEDMKSNLSPIPEKIVQAQMAAIVKGSKGKIKKIQIDKSLGAASVGQAFLCRLFGPGLPDNGKEVVIKLLRPDVRNRMLREKAVMLDCADKTDKNHGMKDTYEGMLERIEEELDLTMEAANVKKGGIYNTEDKRVETMKLSDIIAPSPTVMVMERAPGITLDQYIRDSEKEINALLGKYIEEDRFHEPVLNFDGSYRFRITVKNMDKFHEDRTALAKKLQELKKRQSYLIEMSKKWVQEGVFGKGFYHGDLHAGNIMISDEKATVIDFGNATTLTSEQQTQIIRMISAAAVGDWKGFRSGYHALLPKSREAVYQRNREKLGAAFKEVFELGDFKYSGQRIGAALLRAQELGLQLPAAIQNFSQCQLRLQNSVDELNKQIEKIQLNLAGFDNAEANDSKINPELAIRGQYDKARVSMRSDSTLEKEIRRLSVPGEEEYKNFSKLLEGTDEVKKGKFETTYLADYDAMRSLPEDFELLQNFYDTIKAERNNSKRKERLAGDLKETYEKCQKIIRKYLLGTTETEFRGICTNFTSYTQDFENALSAFREKAERVRSANVTGTYRTLLEEYRALQADPGSTQEMLETKRRELFEEYKKIHETYFMTAGPLSEAVVRFTEMSRMHCLPPEDSTMYKELKPYFEDEECKGKELRDCYLAYANEIARLEKEREEKERIEKDKIEDEIEKRRFRLKREESEDSIKLRAKFFAAYRESAILRFQKWQKYNEQYKYLHTQSAPDNFLNVMGAVIKDNLTSAVFKLGKYAIKYRKQLAAQNNH